VNQSSAKISKGPASSFDAVRHAATEHHSCCSSHKEKEKDLTFRQWLKKSQEVRCMQGVLVISQTQTQLSSITFVEVTDL